jgi:hypothetical protein
MEEESDSFFSGIAAKYLELDAKKRRRSFRPE